MTKRLIALALAGVLALAAPCAQAADNMTVKDGSGSNVTLRSKDVGAGVQAPVHVPMDSAGGDMTDTTLHALKVAGTTSNASSGVATSSTNAPVVSFNYCWNGATWDQCASGSAVTVTSGTISLTANQGVTETPNVTATYTYSFSGLVLAASATDFLTITNTTASKVTRLQRLTLTCTAASAAQMTVTLVKRSTALDSGGTSATLTAVPVDSAFSAAQSIVKTYTANPASLGTLVGNARQEIILAQVTTAQPDRLMISFGGQSASQPAVRSATETIALNAGGATTGGTCSGTVELTEL